MAKNIIFEASGEFPFTFYIEKAIAAEETEKELILEGVASTMNIDHDNERMGKTALEAMANIINEKSVPLRVEHSKSENAIIGEVFKAHVDERNQLHIKARLDKAHPVSPILYHSVKELGKKMGFSVGGLVKHAVREFSEAAGKLIKTFYDVELKEVSVTPRPANYDAWAVAKSIAREGESREIEKSRSMFYDEFLFENPKLDYLQAFAKSVPDEAWSKVDAPHDIIKSSEKSMATDDKDKKDDKDTEKAITRKEFSVVVKGIATLAKAFEAFVTTKGGEQALDQRLPDKVKPEDESATAKAADDKEDDKKEDKEKAMGEDALDQRQPDAKKPDDESGTAKATDDDKDEDKEKAAKGDKDEDEYDMDTVERSISSLESLTKKLQGVKKADDKDEDEEKEKAADDNKDEEKEKAADDDKDEDKEKSMHPMDKFVLVVTKAVEAMADKMEKSGKHVLGFEKAIVDRIVSDPALQEEIQKMLKVPGAKKSVVMGTPMMVTKEGKRYALTASEVGAPTVEKSRTSDKKQSFKDVYKSEYSSVREMDSQ